MNLPKDKNELKKEYFSWLYKNQENLKPIISDAIDSIYNVYQQQFDTTDVDNIRNGLKLNHLNCWALAEYVNEFAEQNIVFRNLITELSNHASSKIRINIITNCLLHNSPKYLVDNLLVSALNDRSKQVRLKVADIMLRLDKKQLVDKLFEQIKIEDDKEVKKTLLWTYELISKKWTFEPERNSITVHLKDGGVSGFNLEKDDDINNIEWIEKKVEEVRNTY